MRGTRFFFRMVTALLIMVGVSTLRPVALSSIVAQLVGVETKAPSLTLSQYSTLALVSSASRISFSWVSAAEAPISSVAPRITSS